MDAKTAAKKSNGSQIFTIPNTPEGLEFRDQLKKYLNRSQYGIHCRGRGKRPSRRYHSSLPQNMADWIAIYINPNKAAEKRQQKIRMENAERSNEYRRKADERLLDPHIKENQALRQQLVTLQGAKDSLEATAKRLQWKIDDLVYGELPTVSTPVVSTRKINVNDPTPTTQKVTVDIVEVKVGGKIIQIEGAKSIKIVD